MPMAGSNCTILGLQVYKWLQFSFSVRKFKTSMESSKAHFHVLNLWQWIWSTTSSIWARLFARVTNISFTVQAIPVPPCAAVLINS